MPITLRHITGDSTWLITFTSPQTPPHHAPYSILLDPWIEGPSPVWHPKFAQNHRTIPSSISNLSELDPQPDLLLISQTKTDHCNEATCRQLPKTGIKVYAVPGADSIVRSWKHFESREVHRLKAFNSRKRGRVSRIPIYRSEISTPNSDLSPDGYDISNPESTHYMYENDPNVAAVLEIAFLPALRPWEIPSLHIGLGISYSPTSGTGERISLPPSPPLTPPATNFLLPVMRPSTSTSTLSVVSSRQSNMSPLSSPISAVSSMSMSSSKPLASSRGGSDGGSIFFGRGRNASSFRTNDVNHKLPGPKSSLTESLLYSPHGVPPSALSSYLSSMPLPIMAFLHCLVRVDNPKWLGGTVSSGAPNAFKIIEDMASTRKAQMSRKDTDESLSLNATVKSRDGSRKIDWALGVKYLIATHDEEVEMEGFCSHFVKKRKFGFSDIDKVLRKILGEEVGEDKMETNDGVSNGKLWKGPAGVSLLDLDVGEEALLI